MQHYLYSSFDFSNPDLAEVFDELPLWAAPFGLRLLEVVRLHPRTTALDIGCGTGFPLVDLAMRLGEHSCVYGVDPWDAGLERIRKKLRVCGVNNVVLHNGVAEHLPFDDDFFDLVVSNNGINNVADMQASLCEVGRVLKPGGQFVMTMNTNSSMAEFYDVYRSVLSERGMQQEYAAIEAHIGARRRPVDEVQQLIENAGLVVNRIVGDTFVLRYANGSALMRHFFVRMAFMSGWREIVPQEMAESVFADIEARLNTHAAQHGDVHLSIPFVVFDCGTVRDGV